MKNSDLLAPVPLTLLPDFLCHPKRKVMAIEGANYAQLMGISVNVNVKSIEILI